MVKIFKIGNIYDMIKKMEMIFLKENIDLETAIEMIQDYAIKAVYPTVGTFNGSVDITKQPENYSLPPRILNQVPDEIIKLYGEDIGTLKWKKLATSIFRLSLVADVRVEVAKLLRDILEMWNDERKIMYKGRDGKDYKSFEEVRTIDDFYTQQENPIIEKGISR